MEPTFTEFMAPGVILSITYFMAVGLTSISFIIERKEGLLDRSWIAGVTSLEVMLAHVVAQFVVMVVQVGFVLVFMLLVFQVTDMEVSTCQRNCDGFHNIRRRRLLAHIIC